ncbi:amidohydrolase family protein [Sphingomonas canadensis]|uniref:Amidohydrolase family protein n=1 Tax=Sphingomonas canadensis TaxID=1219257 RepID=A0ABW3H8L4_9SPHN|nr:amidohydrolase family protein [Sphingomonas canadensis]MCW3837133.1 amidohydrolase family protein [Sphingomonas canadensis]
MIRTIATALALAIAGPALAQSAAPAPGAAPVAAKVTYIHAGRLLDRPGQPPRGNSTIIVRDGRIAEVRDGFAAPEGGAALIDLKDRFVLPGLIDLHVHLLGIGGDPMRARLLALTNDDADDLLIGISNARVTIDAGFTTIRDPGDDPRSIRALRDAIERGDVAGPTIVNGGLMLSVTGGHGDGSNGVRADVAEMIIQKQEQVCDGAVDCARAVRRQIALGAQVIKFAATGGVLSNVSGGLGRAMTPEEMRAIVETAHGLGRKVAAHSHAADGTKAALIAGVDTIEHGSFLDDEAIRLFKEKGAWLVPTMLAPRAAVAQARGGALPPAVIPKAEEAAAAAFESHKKAIAAGVKIAFGTDTGVSKHGDNAQEFALMVKAGMKPADAIAAATVNAADALGRKGELGSIEPGKWADIIAVSGDPLSDVTRLESVEFVMRRGAVHKAGGKRQGFPPQ